MDAQLLSLLLLSHHEAEMMTRRLLSPILYNIRIVGRQHPIARYRSVNFDAHLNPHMNGHFNGVTGHLSAF